MSSSIIKLLAAFICGFVFAVLLVTNIYHADSRFGKNIFAIQEETNVMEKKRNPAKIENVRKAAENINSLIVEETVEHDKKKAMETETVVMKTSIKKDFVDIYAKDKLTHDDSPEFWKKAKHYNIDDYGVPIEEYALNVESMMKLSQADRLKRLKERDIKTVLYMHAAYGSKTYGFNYPEHSKQGQLPYIMKGCNRRDCFCTDDQSFLPMDEFDAIVFYSRGIRQSDRPSVRKPHQRYILWEVEPPLYLMSFNPASWNNFFNWTHTYRRDSDIWEPWGMMNQIAPYPKDVDQMIEDMKNDDSITFTKTKSVAWFVSNCGPKSGRDRFIRELQKYITVDIYGACGTLSCPRHQSEECWNMVERDYFFYFAAENSLCKDYISEKFFKSMQKKVVTISFGGGDNTNDYYFTPKKSYINAFDFKGPKELADFLLKLQADIPEYRSYYWWKPYYNLWMGRWKKAHCEICDQLHENKEVKTYKDVQDWWVTQSKCKRAWGS